MWKLNPKLFKKLFYKENKSGKEIAEELGITRQAVYKYRYEHGFPKKFCSGPKNNKWKGGKYLHSCGYLYVKFGKSYIFEHRLIMSKHLGRPLKKNEVVHHKNGNRLDNRIKNLCIHNPSSHGHLHYPPGSKFGIHSIKSIKRS